MPVYFTGPDVSHHQGFVDWGRVKDHGHLAAICKATEGTSFVDSRFWENRQAIQGRGMLLGAYHFLRRGNAQDQARHFVNTINPHRGVLMVVDCETSHTGTNPTHDDIVVFCNQVQSLTGRRPIVYTYNAWWVANCGARQVPADYLWIARYRPRNQGYGPTPPGKYKVLGWQWSSTFACPGISGGCDMNEFYVPPSEWSAIAGSKQQIEDDEMTPEDREWVKELVWESNRRLGHVLTTGRPNGQFDPRKDPRTEGDYSWVENMKGLNDLVSEGQAPQFSARGFIDALLEDAGDGRGQERMRQLVKDALREMVNDGEFDHLTPGS